MNEAIKLARDNGYLHTPNTGVCMNEMSDHIFLDPLFWQALGKALGWADECCVKCGADYWRKGKICCGSFEITEATNTGWIVYALRYHELSLRGGDTEKFWKELLNK